jgi:hypothetical protein
VPRGGKRPGAGRKAGVTPPSRVRRVPATATDKKIDNLLELELLLDKWEIECLNNASDPKYSPLRQALIQIRRLGY